MQNKWRWTSAVGDDPASGGGVARAVALIKEGRFSSKEDYDYLSVLGMSKIQQIRCAVVDLLIHRYRSFVVHSVFSPYSWVILLFPFGQHVVIFPHGELKESALCLSSKKKKVIIFVMRFMSFLFSKFRIIHVVASNESELNKASRYLSTDNLTLIPDIVMEQSFFRLEKKYDSQSGLNLINIARMVPNKGIGDFLSVVLERKMQGLDCKWLDNIEALHIFYAEEDVVEEERVSRLVVELFEVYGVVVKLYKNLDGADIRKELDVIPNKLPVLSSRFESFSYALIEVLTSEYVPITWFSNELTDLLSRENMCISLPYGVLPDIGHVQLTDYMKLKQVKKEMIDLSSAQYQKIFDEVVGAI